MRIMPAQRSSSSPLSTSLCCFLSYLLIISLCAPLTVRRAEAATKAVRKATTPAPVNPLRQRSTRRERELIVRFRESVSEQDKNSLVASQGARRKRKLRGMSRIEKLELATGREAEAAAEQLRHLPAVEFAEPNYLISREEIFANDTRFFEQWALRNIGQTGGQFGSDINTPTAWETTTGAPTTVIAVIDSGIDFTHPDLQNNRWANSAEQLNGVDDDHNGLIDDLYGWDFTAGDNDASDEHGHGTMMAGAIAAEGNNAIGISGVMWRASLMNLRVLNNTGTGDIGDAVEAIDYAAANGAQVINCSWGTDGASLFLREAIERAGQRGVIIVTSAGNSGRDITSSPQYPASYELSNVISVAATDHNDQLASWSNYSSTQVTVAAPGADILTTEVGGGYRTATGSSISAALVTGIVGLIKTVRPQLSPTQTKAAITNGARQVASLVGKVSSGGVVDAGDALDSLQEIVPTPTPTPLPGDSYSTPGGSSTIGLPDLDASRNIEPADPVAPTQIVANTLPVCGADCGGSIPAAGTTNPLDTDFSTERTDPLNNTGDSSVNLLSRNFNWGESVVSLPGRSGLDMNLSLVYNSLVWTKQNGAVRFNADRGFPGAGFRLGFPVIQQRYYNAEVGKYAYMLVTPSGSRVELRQIGTSNIYESADGSYIQMTDNGATGATVLTPDGTKMTYDPIVNSEMHCKVIKDRNGNYLTIAYNSFGRPASVIDTLNRTIAFVYDANNYLTSIRQTWNGVTHTWATFSYGTLAVQTNFPGLVVEGPTNGSSIPVLTQVGLHDGSHYNFEYTSWGQIWKISSYAADNHLLSYTSYNLPLNNATAQADSPRFTQQKTWAEDWNGDTDGVAVAAEEALTQYSTAADGSSAQVTMADNNIYKELYATGATNWQRGLVTGTENWSGGVKKKWTMTAWTQDDTIVSYPLNPRPTEINIYDEAGNRRRSTVAYLPPASFSLPSDVYEYDSNGTTLLRQTHTDYLLTTTYTNRRLIGLASKRTVKDGAGVLFSQMEYQYDEGGIYFDTTDAPVRHDATLYGTTFIAGRGNVTSVRRINVTTPTQVSESNIGYNIAGSVVLVSDPLGHTTNIDYTDTFSDTTKNTLGTFAYLTKITNPGGFYSTSQYHYDFGAVTKTSIPSSGTGASITYLDHQMTYDTAARLTKVLNLDDNSYTRWVFPTSQTLVQQYQTINTANTAGEVYSTKVLDGAGRTTGTSTEHPGSAGLYSGQLFVYDKMGFLLKQSNPTEMTTLWSPTGDDVTAGWKYTQQTYDWKGRPLLTTNTDGTITEAAYGGCGCAGGEVTTIKGEVLSQGRRQQKIYKDVLGRVAKTEILNWDGSVYSTVKNTYNVRDQVTNVRQYAGADTSATYQDTVMTYDGHARLLTKRTPEQTAATQYAYNADDTLYRVTDARGAYATFTYSVRHQVTNISFTAPTGITATSPVSYSYDAAANRTSMTDGSGSITYSYDQFARLTSETKQFSGLTGSYALSYIYNLAGELTRVTDPTGAQVNYVYDKTGRVTSVTGTAFGGVTQYLTGVQYRAWGAVKSRASGDGRTTTISYNSRLLPTDFSVSNLMSKHYEYNPDGDLRYSQDLLDNDFDRSYKYDHVNRLMEALSGPAARGEVDTDNRPYKLTYSYDQLDHLTSRSGKIWSTPHDADTGSGVYTNNRNTGWQYDADGRLKLSSLSTYGYDAAGRMTDTATSNADSETTQAQAFDGDGTRTKLYTERIIYNADGSITNEAETQYFVTSSVLHQVVTELNTSGQKARTFVYQGGQVLALQKKSGATETIGWEYRDLSNASAKGSIGAELEPMGSNAGLRAPLSTDPVGPLPDLVYPGFGEASSGESMVDGINMPYELMLRVLATGAATIDTKTPPEAASPLGGQIPIYGRFCVTATAKGMVETECSTEITGYTSVGSVGVGINPQESDPCAEDPLLVRFSKLRDESRTNPILPYIHSSVAQKFQSALDEINAAVPNGIGFTEFFRTRAIQEGLWNDRANNPNPVAPPGTSRHESGFAFDVPGVAYRDAQDRVHQTELGKIVIPIFERYGFMWGGMTINDPPHFQADPTSSTGAGYASFKDAIAASAAWYARCGR
jgi:YD repeat-containing protein